MPKKDDRIVPLTNMTDCRRVQKLLRELSGLMDMEAILRLTRFQSMGHLNREILSACRRMWVAADYGQRVVQPSAHILFKNRMVTNLYSVRHVAASVEFLLYASDGHVFQTSVEKYPCLRGQEEHREYLIRVSRMQHAPDGYGVDFVYRNYHLIQEVNSGPAPNAAPPGGVFHAAVSL